MGREPERSSGIADGWHSEVGGSAAAVSLDAPVEAGEFAFSGSQADLQALDFPSQPFIRASAMRSCRLLMISVRRGRCCGETRSIAQRRQA